MLCKLVAVALETYWITDFSIPVSGSEVDLCTGGEFAGEMVGSALLLLSTNIVTSAYHLGATFTVRATFPLS